MLWFALRRRHARIVLQGGEKEQPLPLPLTKGTPKLYVGIYSFIILVATDRVSPGPFGSNDLPEQRLLATEKATPRLY